jgi:integrase
VEPLIGHVKVGNAGLADDDDRCTPRRQCGLRWKHVDLEHAVLTYERSIAQDEDGTWEKDTKQHQQRRNALDPETVTVLAEHWSRCQERAAALGVALTGDEFVFSNTPTEAGT